MQLRPPAFPATDLFAPGRRMRPAILLLLILLALAANVRSQSSYFPDSLKHRLANATTDQERASDMMGLARYYTGDNNALADDYASKALQVAELSRDRKLMADTYIRNGGRLLNLAGLAGNIQRALDNFAQAEKIAKENGLDASLALSYCSESKAYQTMGDHERALRYSNQALNIAGNLNDDTVKLASYVAMGDAYLSGNEKLLAFRNYLDALNIAELSKKNSLLGAAYDNLRDFYSGIEEYDKAIDQVMKVMDIDRRANNRYRLMGEYNTLGNLFAAKKQDDIARKMYENAISMADSLHLDLFKINSYLGIFNMYFNNNDFDAARSYAQKHTALMDFIHAANLEFFFDEAYGYAYAQMGKLDSAGLYFRKAEPDIEKKANPFGKYQFYTQYGDYYRRKKDDRNAIAYYMKARGIGESMHNLKLLQDCDNYLDSLYEESGDFKTAYAYNQEYNTYKDSLRTLSREADLLKLEVDNDNRRRERLAKEEEEIIQHRHNVQYMGLTAGLASLFIILVMLGFFVVHPGTIRALGFFSFIFLFEFIILLTDKQIHEWTHGEPWKILLVKICLAAGLLPLHHWLEHKVIHYLTSRRKIATPGMPFLGRRKKETATTKA